MCGRFALGADDTLLAAQLDLFAATVWSLRYAIAPTQEILVVELDPATARRQAGRRKQPYHVRMRGERPFAFAGLWEGRRARPSTPAGSSWLRPMICAGPCITG
jgi:putative SOS response-associated peptidase YedK